MHTQALACSLTHARMIACLHTHTSTFIHAHAQTASEVMLVNINIPSSPQPNIDPAERGTAVLVTSHTSALTLLLMLLRVVTTQRLLTHIYIFQDISVAALTQNYDIEIMIQKISKSWVSPAVRQALQADVQGADHGGLLLGGLVQVWLALTHQGRDPFGKLPIEEQVDAGVRTAVQTRQQHHDGESSGWRDGARAQKPSLHNIYLTDTFRVCDFFTFQLFSYF